MGLDGGLMDPLARMYTVPVARAGCTRRAAVAKLSSTAARKIAVTLLILHSFTYVFGLIGNKDYAEQPDLHHMST